MSWGLLPHLGVLFVGWDVPSGVFRFLQSDFRHLVTFLRFRVQLQRWVHRRALWGGADFLSAQPVSEWGRLHAGGGLLPLQLSPGSRGTCVSESRHHRHTRTHAQTQTHARTHTHASTHTQRHTWMHKQTHAQTHTHSHARTQTQDKAIFRDCLTHCSF